VENAIFAAANEVATLGDDEDTGGTQVLIFVYTAKVAECAPEVDNGKVRFAVIHAGDASCITQLHEALTEITWHGSRIHPVTRREINVFTVNRRPRARHPHSACTSSRSDIPDSRRRSKTGITIKTAHIVRHDESVSWTARILAIDRK